MKRFNFRKIVRRNSFSQVFKSFGMRRTVLTYVIHKVKLRQRTKMQQLRRASQGYRNKIFGRVNAIKMRRIFGRLNKVPQFRR
jgi:hypothetical protein